jgi:hypothetical protein
MTAVGYDEMKSVNRAKQQVDCGLSGDFGNQAGPSFRKRTVAN